MRLHPTKKHTVDGKLVPEPITALSVIRDVACPGSRGHIGEVVAASILHQLDEAGFEIIERSNGQ